MILRRPEYILDRPQLDHAGLFDASPNPYLVLDRSLNIAGANRAYLAATKRELADLVGRWAWDAFPAEPETVRQSVASFERVLRTGEPDTMALLRFDIPRPEAEGGGFEERWWSIVHAPVPDEDGEVAWVLQHPIDVTELKRLRDAAGGRLAPAHSGIFGRARAVQEANLTLQAESERLRALFEQAPGFMCVLRGPEHRFELANAAYARLVGGRDVLGAPVREALPELEGQGFFELLDRVYATGEPFVGRGMEIALRAGPGAAPETRFVDFVYQPITDPDGRVSGIFVQGNDVTEAERATGALRAERDRSRGILESMAEGFLLLDRDWRVVEINAEGLRIDGRPREAIVGRRLLELWPEAERMPAWPAYRKAMAERVPVAFEYRHVSDAHDVWLDVRAYPVADGGLAAIYRDVTDRKRAEAALRGSEARLARLLALTPAGIIELDAAGRIAYANAAAERILDAGPGGLGGRRHDDPAWGAAAGDGAPIPPERLPGARALAGEAVADHEQTVTALDGRRAVLLVDAVPVRDEAGRVEGALVAFQDVTARHAQARALREGEERLRFALEAGGLGDYEWDLRADAVAPSDRAREIFAFAPGEGGRPADYFGRMVPEDVAPARAAVEAGLAVGRVDVTYRIRPPGGTVRHLFSCGKVARGADGAPARLIGVFADETERKRMEDELRRLNAELEQRVEARTADLMAAEAALRQSQKMEAVGQLTGGIAHDFNNMLQGIGGALELARRRVEQGRTPDAFALMDAARQGVVRAAGLTHRLLAFARRQALDPKPVVLDGLVRGLEELIRRTVGPGVAVELRHRPPGGGRSRGVMSPEGDRGGGAWPVLCDANQLENVLLNLAINARDAMPDGGTLTLATAEVRLSAADVAGQDGAAPGEYVEVAVCDTGTGMTPDVMARAFEPFFTTKPIGQGTGLGLSQLYGFVRQSGGFVRLDSAPGRGTTVRLYLPRHTGGAAAAAAEAPGQTEVRAASAGTVLLVEDEAAVRAVAAERLRELGYAVLEAGDGPTALRLLRMDARVDALVTDVGLPGGMNGRQVADAARERRPDLPVLFITGYAGAALDGRLAPGMEVIGKPFALDALAAKVRAMLEASPVA